MKQTIVTHILQMKQKDDRSASGFEAFLVWFGFFLKWLVGFLVEELLHFCLFVLKGISMPSGSTKQ